MDRDDSRALGSRSLEASSLGAADPSEFTRTRSDVERFQRGEHAAFDEIWARYRPALEMLVALRVMSRLEPDLRSRIDADDILQETAQTVRRKLGEFRYLGPGSILGWMTTIVLHVVTDQIRYWRARIRDPARQLALDSDGRDLRSPPAAGLQHPGTGPATAADRAEVRRLVADALARLPDRQQTIVLWRFFGGASWEEVAAEVGSPSADAVRMEFNGKILPLLATLLPRPG